MIYLIFIAFAAFFNGFCDVNFNMFYGSKLDTARLNPKFWNPYESFKYATNIAFIRFDSWHIGKALWIGFVFDAIITYKPLFSHWYYDYIALIIVWGVFFQLALIVFKNKK